MITQAIRQAADEARNAALREDENDQVGALNAALDSIKKAVAKGDSVTLVGFGSFSSGKRAARTGRNPRTGETIKIPAAKTVKFSAGQGFKDAVNKKK